MGNRRPALLALAWLATAIAAGFLFAWLLHQDRERIVVVREPGPPEARRGAPPAGHPPEVREPAPSSTRPPVPGEGDDGPGGAAPSARAFPTLEVAVVPAGGQDLAGGTVYALEPGAPGPEDEDDVPHAELGEDLTAILHLPGPGPYDVGFSCTLGSVMATDVLVEEGPNRKLVLRMAGSHRVRALCDPPWMPGSGDSRIQVSLGVPDSRTLKYLPGRDEDGPSSAAFDLGPGGTGESPVLVPGRTYGVHAQVLERGGASLIRTIECIPPLVRPGETVRLRLRERAGLVVHVVRPEDLGDPPSLPVHIEFRQGDRCVQTDLPLNPTFRLSHDIAYPAEPGPGTFSWSGDRVAPGRVEDLVFESGKVREITVPLSIVSAAAAAAPEPESDATGEPPPEAPVPVEVRGIPEGTEPGVSLFGPVDDEGGETRDIWTKSLSKGEVDLHSSWRRVGAAYAVAGPHLASDPVAVPAAGPLAFVLKPAGILVASPDEWIPEGLGRLTLRLPDRRPIPTYDEENQDLSGASDPLVVGPGMLVGPLPEGTYTFEVRLGGVRLPDATATVKAGRIEVLRIRTRRP